MADTPSLNDEIRALDAGADDDRRHDPKRARKKAMDLLARREHTAGELQTKLERADVDPDVALAAIEALTAEGLQSDERFVEAFVQSRINQGKGPVRIRADLNQRGVHSALIEQALDAADADWRQLAAETRQRKFGTAAPRDFKEKARQMRFLQYRGFEPEQIHAVVGD